MNLSKLLRRILSARLYNRIRAVKHAPARLFQWSMERCGFIVARAADYYSPLPSRSRLKSSLARWTAPSSMRGIEYDLDDMKASLSRLINTYYTEFQALLPYEHASSMGIGPGYTRLDAIVLYAMIRASKPKRYLEIGSGISTYYAAIAAQANARKGHGMRVTCIEPHPFPTLLTIPGISIKTAEVQDEPLGSFTELGEDDILFIDSSHIVRLDGDVPFLFLEVLPALRTGVMIHVHDIPFPYHGPYPSKYWIYETTWPFWWTESMLLHALLCRSTWLSIKLSAPLIRYHDEAFLADLVPGYETIEQEPNTFSSIWLRRHD